MGRIKCRELSAARKIRKQRKGESRREAVDLVASFEKVGVRGSDTHDGGEEEVVSESGEADFWCNLIPPVETSGRSKFIPEEPERFRRDESRPSRLQRLMANRTNTG